MFPSSNGSSEELEKFPDLDYVPPAATVISEKETIDAGLKSLDHYRKKMSPWRYQLRRRLLPLIRWETPYLAWMQDKMRTPILDSYFAITANLGTHTFFMTALPILFWCGHTSLGRAMVHVLASGVFLTGFIKDMVSLPRPLSPPLHRITMSGSAALEYGFPSTHSANAVSVAVYTLFAVHSPDSDLLPTTKLVLEIVSYLYAFSIILGRLYCGMHGFFDVIIGSLIGALISVVECVYGPNYDNYLHASYWHVPFLIAVIVLVLVRIHPEPVDDCPCFDDSVAFAGVYMGVEIGGWHYARGAWAWDYPAPGTVPFDFERMGWMISIVRIVTGVLIIFAWREVMKPLLLKSLPHLFRIIEKLGLSLPRRFFVPASKYSSIPSRFRFDNVMPSISDLPKFFRSLRHPGRGRSVSIGPQSAADAYETLAYRDKRRRESITGSGGPQSSSEATGVGISDKATRAQVSGVSPGLHMNGSAAVSTPPHSRVSPYEQMMGQGHVLFVPPSPSDTERLNLDDEPDIVVGRGNELGEKEMFEKIEKPRVRYDVEVVTKLVVYSGIAWLSVDGVPMIFEMIGLGVGGDHQTIR